MFEATRDKYIYNVLNDPLYEIRIDALNATIWSQRNRHGATGVWRQVATSINSSGYYQLNYYLPETGQNKKLRVNRIIYAKFVGELDPYLIVDHKDNNKLNNHPSNLIQITQRRNSERNRKERIVKEKKIKGSDRTKAIIAALLKDELYLFRPETGEGFTYRTRGTGISDELRSLALKAKSRGYPVFKYKNTNLYLHQVIYTLVYGPIPLDKEVDHDNQDRSDCRAENLKLHTSAENCRNRGTTKLNDRAIVRIKELYERGMIQEEIAKRFGISQSHVSLVITGRLWNEVI